MDRKHPVALKMRELGCSCSITTSVAFLTYIDLCEVYAKKNVDYAFNEKLDLIYITSTEKFGKKNIYVPFYYGKDVSIAELENVCTELITDDSTDLYICLRELDTTTVFYKLSNGLAPPLSPESMAVKKAQEDEVQFKQQEFFLKKRKIYSQLKSQESLIMQPANSQVQVVTLPCNQEQIAEDWVCTESGNWDGHSEEQQSTVISLPETDDSCEVIEEVPKESEQVGDVEVIVDDSPKCDKNNTQSVDISNADIAVIFECEDGVIL